MMEMRHFGLVFLALLLSSGTILINRCVTRIPTWMATIFAVIAVGNLILYAVLSRRDAKRGAADKARSGKKKG